MIQESVRGTPPNDTKDIQKRRRGRPSKKEKIGEKYQAEEEQVDLNPIVTLVVEEENQRKGPKWATEDKTEVMGMEIEENLRQDEEQDVIVRIGQQGLEDVAGKEQNQPEKQKNDAIPCERHKEVTEELGRPRNLYKVTWVGCRGHIKGKIASVEQRPSRNEQNTARKEENQPSEQDTEGTKRQCHQRKQYDITWIGRGVRKFTEAGKDFLEQQSKAEVIGLEEDVINEHNVFSCDVKEHLEGLRQREAKGVVIEKNGASLGCNQEDWKHDVVEQQISLQEQLIIKMSENIQLCSQQERSGMELEVKMAEKLQKERPQNEVLQQSLQLEDKVMEQDLLNVRSEAQKDGFIEQWNGQQKQVKGASVDQSGSQLQQIDATREHFDLQERSMEEMDDTCQSCGQLQRGSKEKYQLEEREVEMPGEVMDEISEEHDPVMIKCEAQVRGTNVETELEEQHNNVTGEQIQPLVQSTKAKEVLSCGEQDRVSIEQEMLQEQVEMDGEPHQHDEQQHEVIQKEQGLMDEDSGGEAQVRVASIEQIESEEQHGYLTEEQVQANKQFTEGSKEGFQLFGQLQIGKSGKEMLEKQVKTAGERHQHEEQQSKNFQKEWVLIDEDAEKPQETESIQTEAIRGVNLAPNKLEEQHDDVAEEQVQPQAQCMESKRELLTGQQHGESIGQEMQEKLVEMAGESYEVKRKERLLMDEIIEEQGVVMSQSETKLRDASVEQHETEDQEGTKEEFQPYGKHQIGKIEKELLGKQAEMACEPHQHEERQTEMTQKERVPMGGDTEEPQDAMMIQSEAQERGASLELNELKEQHENVTEELVQPQERYTGRTDEKLLFWGHDRVKDGEFESAEERLQKGGQQTEVIQKKFMLVNEVTEVRQDVLLNQSEGQVEGECFEENESDEHQCVTGKCLGLQEDCMEARKEEFQSYGQHRDIMEQVQLGNGEAEIPGGGHQQEQSSEMKEKHIGLMKLCDIKQGLVIMQSKAQGERASAEHDESEMHQDQLEEREIEIAEEQPQQEGQDNKVLQKEIEIMCHLTEVTQDSMRTQHEAQVEGTSVKLNESEKKQNNTAMERVASQELCMEETKEESQAIKELYGQQHEEMEAILEKIQKEECENGVTVQRCHPQEQWVEGIKERPVQQIEMSEKENQPQGQCVEISSERTGSSDGIVKGSRAFPLESPDVEKMCLSHHQNQDEQRQPSRRGLRSRYKKQEGNPNAEVTPVRRSPRLYKTILEATTATEGVDSFGGPPKKKPKNAAA